MTIKEITYPSLFLIGFILIATGIVVFAKSKNKDRQIAKGQYPEAFFMILCSLIGGILGAYLGSNVIGFFVGILVGILIENKMKKNGKIYSAITKRKMLLPSWLVIIGFMLCIIGFAIFLF